MGITTRFKNAWSAFSNNKDPTLGRLEYSGDSYRPDRYRKPYNSERSIVNAIINRIAVDAASTTIQHVKTSDDGYYESTVNSFTNQCLNVSANIDQTAFTFKQDLVESMLGEGCVAVVPTKTDLNPNVTDGYDVYTMRVCKITRWHPKHVTVELYNEDTGKKEEMTYLKDFVLIIENPFYSVMNAQSSTLQRLIRKSALLDEFDERSTSGKLDLIIQLPYVIKTEARRKQAEIRRNDIEKQLEGSKYGIAYTDGTEKIQQLNRPIENNLMDQIKFLTEQIFSQLGITQSILDGTADEQTLVNYNTRTLAPILTAITEEMTRKFLTVTARSKNEKFMFFKDPFTMVPVGQIAQMSDSLTRNEIMSSNEVRQRLGMKPSADPRADELINKNLNHQGEDFSDRPQGEYEEEEEY